VALVGDPGDDASRAGLPWPQADGGVRVARSGGFENLALAADGASLYAMLEKPLEGRELLAFAFSLRSRRFEGVAFRYPLDPRAVAVGDFAMIDATHGYALERDNSDGALDGFKRLVEFTLPAERGGLVTKRTAVDLEAIPTADGGTFSFPFWTTEGVAVSREGVTIINDNNYPFGRARSRTQPDSTELIVVRVPR
jgi:glycerophosphoryl diester phosphodiesterase